MLKDKAWIFKTSLKDWIKYFYNRFLSSKYVVKGKCKKCGTCCRTILLSDENGYIKDEEQFKKLQEKYKRYKIFEISGRLEENNALMFKCKALKDNGLCGSYFFRSLYCRNYPAINSDFITCGGTTLDGCGYYFDVNKKFKEYIK